MLTYLYDTEKRKPKESSKQYEQYAMFSCVCGNTTEIYKRHGLSGKTLRCRECGYKEKTKHSYKHGMSRSKEYIMLFNMIQRCYNKKNNEYHNYGARGITIRKEWMTDKESFFNYIKTLDNFDKEGYSIDRIDVNGNYDIGNIRYTSKIVQSNNKRFNAPVNGFYGVRKHRNRFIAEISNNGKYVYLCSRKTALECAIIREEYINKHNLLNIKNKELINAKI